MKVLDIERLFQDYGISYVTSGHKHAREGWVNTTCPFCTGNPGYHLGYNTRSGYFKCWRCGWHPVYKTLEALLHSNKNELNQVKQQYETANPAQSAASEQLFLKNHNLDNLKSKNALIESGLRFFDEPQEYHLSYLKKRRYNIHELINLWNIKFTDHLGDYRFRIIAPIILNGSIISFQGRDVTGKSEAKYKACSQKNETMPHKWVLYGWDYVFDYKKVVVVEGITDVWRLGPGSVATFGVQYSLQQIKWLTHFQEVYIYYDPDEAGIESARKMMETLDSLDVETHIIEHDKDPGDLTKKEALHLMELLFGNDL